MKFSDPNYYLLKQYFDQLLQIRNGVQKSYLIGPNHTVVSEGGVYSILYEDHPDRGYVGHRFKIVEITGNRFIMTYEGLESSFSITVSGGENTTTAELSAFGIGNGMYFRKDSFFHYWLARPTQDASFHDYANQERTFLYFGKIWPTNTINTYSIEFDGMKDYTLRSIPQHQQTVNMTEWLKVYFDQIHHEQYNMTKTFWSMLDPREIDLKWIGYMAGIYGIDINEDFLSEISLREWVENLPYFLKRLGTYDAIYVVWNLVKTNNALNVYERWGEWCTQNVAGTVDTFNDYHFLQFYGQTPSGGAGSAYYDLYDPVLYPIHATTPPDSGCTGINQWDCGNKLNYFSFVNLNITTISSIDENEITIDGYDHNTDFTQILALSGQNYPSSGFKDCVNITMHSPTSAANLVFWGISNETKQFKLHTGAYLAASFQRSPITGNIYWQLSEGYGGTDIATATSTEKYYPNVTYYTTIQRVSNYISLRVFSKNRRWDEDLLETIVLGPLTYSTTFTVLHSINGIYYLLEDGTWDGQISGHYQDAEYSLSIPLSGYPVITPHYIVEMDLSTEPVGENYDTTWIMDETTINELIRNWEYVRPVSKYSHYRELIAPLATIDRVGKSVPLYDLSFLGYLNTFFTGAQYISAGSIVESVNTYSHFQQFASTTWTITHNLNSKWILVQPWVFDNLTEKSKMVQPHDVQIGSNNTVQLTFDEPVRGIATVAGNISGSDGTGITYMPSTNLSASDFVPLSGSGGLYYKLTIDHNLNSDTPSAYSQPPGVVFQIYDQNGYKVTPRLNDITESTFDRFISEFQRYPSPSGNNPPSGGGYLIRRSDYIHTQNDPANVWTINHNLNGWCIVQFYNLIDNYREIFPEKIEAVDSNTLKVYWETNTRGFAHIIFVPRDRTNYSPYSCDILGLGMCPETLGYWKVGTGLNDAFNPFSSNDLEIPVASGGYKAIYEDDDNGYIDFEVPDTVADVSISEVGLFDYLDRLIFYTRCTELFKPEGTSCFFHYRVTKL